MCIRSVVLSAMIGVACGCGGDNPADHNSKLPPVTGSASDLKAGGPAPTAKGGPAAKTPVVP